MIKAFLSSILGLIVFSFPAALPAEKPSPASDRERSLSRIAALPYLQVKSPPVLKTGVLVHEQELVYPGWNFCVSWCPPRAFVMDMEGNLLHQWAVEVAEAWPEMEERWDGYNWRNAHLYPDGGLLAVCPELGLLRLDRDSKILWKYAGDYIAHHDLDLDGEGNIYLLTHRELESHPQLELTGAMLEDYITVLDPRGRVKEQISVLECFLNSDYRPLLDGMEPQGDNLHTNTLEYIDGRLADRVPFLQAGTLLIAVRELSVIAVIDPGKKKVVWALTGLWRYPHHPTPLANGNFLIFDNCGPGGRRSRVLEFNPLTQEVVWFYGEEEENQFYSRYSSSCHRLPNGNTLIIQSDFGRAFEVTPEKKIVWEYLNPFRPLPGEDGGSLYETWRIAPDEYPFLRPASGQ